MFDAWSGAAREVEVTLYTDAYVIRGRAQTTQRRLSDVLNFNSDDFLVLSDPVFEALGGPASVHRAPFAQVNLQAVLFAVSDDPPDSIPELRTRKSPELALISIPPFEVIGHIHLVPEQSPRAALGELTARFVPVTDARFSSERLGVPERTAHMVAVNHARAQILSPFGSTAAGQPTGTGTEFGADPSGAEPGADPAGGEPGADPLGSGPDPEA